MAMNPQLGGLDPQMRQIFQSEQFRQMMWVRFRLPPHASTRLMLVTFRSNPETLRSMLQMSNMMRDMGAGPTMGGFPGMGGGLGGFGGAANPTPAPNLTPDTRTTVQTPSTTGATNTTSTTAPNPFLDPAMMQQLMGAFGGAGGGGLGGGPGGGFGGGGLFGAPATPTDTRPPEERFQVQLQVSVPQEGQAVGS